TFGGPDTQVEDPSED
ncbi:hypothetical protein A2U01_0069915, partial [Trifolium medium]|nr:hypothetical protein [Trifolium medium]